MRAGGSTPRLVATIDALTAERDEWIDMARMAYADGTNAANALTQQDHDDLTARAIAAEAQVERLIVLLTDARDGLWHRDDHGIAGRRSCPGCDTEVRITAALAALASEGSSK